MNMTKKLLIAVLILGFFAALTANNSVFAQSSPTVSVKVSKSVKPGGTGTLTIKFKHGPKVKIPSEPAIEITLNGEGITPQGEPTFNADAEGYINNSTIKYNFKVGSNSASGSTINITGKIKFGYCSTETGVCKFGDQNFNVSVKVK